MPNILALSKSIRKSISSLLNDNNLFNEWICNSPASLDQEEFKDPTPIAVSVDYLKEAFGLNAVNSDQEENINDEEIFNLVKYHNLENGEKILIGYPTLNFSNVFQEIAFIWILWSREGKFPTDFQQFTSIEDDFAHYTELSTKFTDRILKLHSMDSNTEDIILDEYIQQICLDIKFRGFQTCLRMRKTTGSISFMIPTYKELIDSFKVALLFIVHQKFAKKNISRA